MKIYFRDRNPELVNWALANPDFAKLQVDVAVGNPTDLEVEAVVSPANSFGFMDGGYDYHLMEFFGSHIQAEVQHWISAWYDWNELPVGDAIVVDTRHPVIKKLVVAPTMRVPMNLPDASNIYLAARAALHLAWLQGIKSIAFSGFGTGIGKISPERSIHAMGRGFTDAMNSERKFRSVREACTDHWDIIGKVAFHTLIPKS
jgi:O-acetyl-ADP-ribose deacetylase (regulator of RNase III)